MAFLVGFAAIWQMAGTGKQQDGRFWMSKRCVRRAEIVLVGDSNVENRRGARYAMSRSLYRKTGHHCLANGFTLIELMIVVAIVAILAAIAYPSYSHYIIKTRRAAATACVSEYANYMERYYTTNLRYDQDDAGTDNPWPTLECAGAQQTGANYSYTPSTLTASTYIIGATPRGPQVADTTCGTLTLNQTGVRTAASDVASCW